MRRILVGIVWLWVLYFGAMMVGGSIAGVIASRGKVPPGATFAEGYAAGLAIGQQAGSAFRETWGDLIFLASVVAAILGTYRGWLPGTAPRGGALSAEPRPLLDLTRRSRT